MESNADVSGEAVDFFRALAGQPQATSTLAWAVETLRTIVDRRQRLRWDDRLGVMAISFGLESALLWLVCVPLPVALWSSSGGIEILRAVLVGLVALAFAAFLGFVFRGGPAFWLTATQVRRADGRLASRPICAWRNLCAWGFTSLSYGASAEIISFASRQTLESSRNFDSQAFGILGLMAGLPFLVHAIGALYALIRPRRGFQDYLAGTYLVPR